MSVISPANLRRIGSQPRLATGLVITLLIGLVAIFGPLFAPYSENEIVGKPYTYEGSFLGTDYLGQDVWSRVLYGGATILINSLLATALGMVLGIIIGVVAAYAGGWLDETIMRLNDVALAFPQILLALLVLTAVPDVLDGAVAKASGTASPRGAFFDSVVDRVSDALLLGGVAWYLASTQPGRVSVLPLAVLVILVWLARASRPALVSAAALSAAARARSMRRSSDSTTAAIA